MAPSTIWFTALLAATANASRLLNSWDLNVLVEADLNGVTSSVKNLFLKGSNTTVPKNGISCKVYPGDAAWPSDEAWSQLNELTGNRLLSRPTPLAAVCYPAHPDYDPEQCATYSATWTQSYTHMHDPIEMMSPVAQGMTCTPPVIFDSHNCTRGGFPAYVVNATEPKHVQLAVNFARNSGVRLVVKNTGHDFLGKSGGKDALSIWTHYMKDIEYIEEFADEKLGYTGPAFKAGTGVQAFEIYKAADEKGRIVVGGEGETVGVMGGVSAPVPAFTVRD